MSPTRASRPCLEPDCPALVDRGRCPAHARPRRPWQHAIESRHARGYDSAHVAMRDRVIREEGACAYCGRNLLDAAGRPLRGVATLDHKLALAFGGASHRGNLAAACRDCQQAKAQRESARGRRRGVA